VVRPATHALYAWVRIADDIVDAPEAVDAPAARRDELDAWHAELVGALAGAEPRHPAVRALVDAGGRHALPLEGLEGYVRSMRADCGPVRMATWGELETYMEGSTGSVGRIMAALLGAPASAADAFARLARGFQLANLLRDVREDLALDRVYLPADDLAAFGAAHADVVGLRATPQLRAAVALEVRRARRLLDAVDEAASAVPVRLRPGMRLAVAVYRRVLDRIEHAGFDVVERGGRLPSLGTA
jgi:15-cis-phytoene synthase